MGLPALNASGSEGRLSQKAQLELQRGQQPARAQWQRLQQLIHEKPVAAAEAAEAAAAAAAAAAAVEQDPGPPATSNSSAEGEVEVAVVAEA
jgi:multidrug resistance efflux pump